MRVSLYERERGRERDLLCACACACVLCARESVYMRERERATEQCVGARKIGIHRTGATASQSERLGSPTNTAQRLNRRITGRDAEATLHHT